MTGIEAGLFGEVDKIAPGERVILARKKVYEAGMACSVAAEALSQPSETLDILEAEFDRATDELKQLTGEN